MFDKPPFLSQESIKTICEPPVLLKYELERKPPQKRKRLNKILWGSVALTFLLVITMVLVKKESTPLQNNYYLKGQLSDFVGRQKYLNLLSNELICPKKDFLHSTKIKVLWGKGGFGKSELAIEFANRHLSDYSLIWTFCCDSRENIYQSYRLLAQRLNLLNANENLEQVKKKVHSYLENHTFARPWLLIFDNVEEEIIDYPQRGGAILVTSQKKILNPQCLIEVEPFSEEESLELLEKISQEKRGIAMRQLVHDLQRIPLLINYAAHYVKATPGCSIDDYQHLFSSRLDEKEGPLWVGMDINRRYLKSLSASWQFSLRSLEKECPLALQWLFVCSYLYPEQIWEQWMDEWLLENMQDKAKSVQVVKEEILEVLQTYGIIRYEPEAKMFSLHRFFQHMIRDSRKNQLHEDLRQTVALMSKHAKDYKFSDSSSWKKGQLWYLHACELRKWLLSSSQKMVGIPEQLALFYEGIGDWCVFNDIGFEALDAYNQALDLRRATLNENAPEIGRTYEFIAWVFYHISRYSEGLDTCEKAANIQRSFLGEGALDYANTLNTKGVILCEIGEAEKALECHKQALTIRLENLGGNSDNIEKDLTGLSSYVCKKSQYSKTLKSLGQYQQASALHEKVVDVGRSLSNVASSLNKLDLHLKALEFNEKATEVYLESCGKENPLYVRGLMGQARTLLLLKRYQKALNLYQRTLQLHEFIRGKKHGDLSSPLTGIGKCYFYLKKYKLAKQSYKKAIQMGKMHFEKTFFLSRAYNGLGWNYLRENKVRKGLKYLIKSLHMSAQEYHCSPAMTTALEDFQKALKETIEHVGKTDIVKQAAADALKICQEELGKDHFLTQAFEI